MRDRRASLLRERARNSPVASATAPLACATAPVACATRRAIMEAADEIARIDGELRPLSLALPDLRLRLHDRHWDSGEEPPAGHWWHARCGHHWTEPVFY